MVQVGRKSMPVKHAVKPPPRVAPSAEVEKDGYRIPRVIESQTHVNALLTQKKNKLRISDLRAAINERAMQAEQQAN